MGRDATCAGAPSHARCATRRQDLSASNHSTKAQLLVPWDNFVSMGPFVQPVSPFFSKALTGRGELLKRRSYYLWPSQEEAEAGNVLGVASNFTGHRRNAFEVLSQLLTIRQVVPHPDYATGPGPDGCPGGCPPPRSYPPPPPNPPYDGEPVDIVYTWVYPKDPVWIALHDAASPKAPGVIAGANGADRFRDYKELKYSLLSMGRLAPWIRNIYIVVCCPSRASRIQLHAVTVTWYLPSHAVASHWIERPA
jgi:hypothetical protein